MQPNFNPDSSKLVKDIILINKYTNVQSTAGQPNWKVGDVVALKSPLNPSNHLIKRISALPGTIIQTLPPHNGGKFIRIPKGHCFLEGDDNFHSRDSNTFGPVPLGLLVGRVGFIIWPLSRFGPLQTPTRDFLKNRISTNSEISIKTKKIKFGHGNGGSPAYGNELGDLGFGGKS